MSQKSPTEAAVIGAYFLFALVPVCYFAAYFWQLRGGAHTELVSVGQGQGGCYIRLKPKFSTSFENVAFQPAMFLDQQLFPDRLKLWLPGAPSVGESCEMGNYRRSISGGGFGGSTGHGFRMEP
jgi:hypothetical protein